MEIIRELNVFDIKHIKELAANIGKDNFLSSRKNFFQPASIINNMLPAKLKFSEDVYVAVIDGGIRGMISLSPRRNNPDKWRIRNLLFDENSYDTGKNLIDYVVTKYGVKGIETFAAEIDSGESAVIDLFSKACGFRYCLDFQYFGIIPEYYKGKCSTADNIFYRPFKNSNKSIMLVPTRKSNKFTIRSTT